MEDIFYYQELARILQWARVHVPSTIYSCHGAHFALKLFYGIDRAPIGQTSYNKAKGVKGKIKAWGVFPHTVHPESCPDLTRGLNDEVLVPVSRWGDILESEVKEKAPGLKVMISSEESGWHALVDPSMREIYLQGHPEYDVGDLAGEYRREKATDPDTRRPDNYFPGDDDQRLPRCNWKADANVFYRNWIICIQQRNTRRRREASVGWYSATPKSYDEDRPETDMGFSTMMLHHGQSLDLEHRARAQPIYMSTSFAFEDSDHAAKLFALQELGPIYSRLMNPTNHVLEYRIAKLEGSRCDLDGDHPSALVSSSGMAAQLQAILTICQIGDNFIASSNLYGGTYTQFAHALPAMGITVKFFDCTKPEEIEALIDVNTKAVYLETIANPSYSVPDFDVVSAICKQNKLPFIVDNTFGMCGYTCRPIKHGADILVESCTKWIGGHGTTIGGVIVDANTFDWSAKHMVDGKEVNKFPLIADDCAAYHGLNFQNVFGPTGPFKCNMAFIFRARVVALRDLGGCQNPLGAFQLLIGLETLSLRGKAHSDNANELAAWLEAHDDVEWVSHCSLPSHPSHECAKKYFRKGTYGTTL
jgi:O-acetylhomoserine (thiol)-lyase